MISIVIPISERHDDIDSLYEKYSSSLRGLGQDLEFIIVLDGDFPAARDSLLSLKERSEPLVILQLARTFGEATALTAGIERARGEVVVTLPAYLQVDPRHVDQVVRQLDDHDMVIARRWPRRDPGINKLQSRLFHSIFNLITESRFRDLGCSVRAFRREVAAEVPIYGDQHRFLPVLANRQGFRVLEIDLPQAAEDARRRIYSPGVYVRRLLDILTVFFLVKFTKKPLRFFGLLGSSTFVVGALLLAVIVAQRLIWQMPLADRPALLLSSLFVVLGLQMLALGLIGELIIFTHARDLREFKVREVIN